MRQIAVRVDDDLHAAIEAARGEIPRERWMRAAFEQALAAAKDAPDRSMRERHRGPMSRAESGGQATLSPPRASAAVVRCDVAPKPFTPPRPKGKKR